MKLRRLLTLALAAAFLLLAPITAKADTTEPRGWVQNETGWWFEYGIDEKGASLWYADGIWEVDQANTTDVVEHYYFNELGYMQVGWIYEKEYDEWYYADPVSGILQTGWQKINGEWYYLHPEYFYMYEDGTRWINDVPYHFAPSGEMTTGWYYHWNAEYEYGDWYYSDASGVVATEGWRNIAGTWYYFGSDGWMYTDTTVSDANGTYYLCPQGGMITGWYNRAGSNSVYGDWMYANADGTLYTGWLPWGADWYYVNNGNVYQDKYKSTYDENGELVSRYYLGRDGKMITGWYDTSYKSSNYAYTSWMYANADGTIEAQWVKSGNDWYFVDSWGCMYADDCSYVYVPGEEAFAPKAENYDTWAEYDKACEEWERIHYYVFDASGKLVTNAWYTSTTSDGTSWWYADANGNGYTGWVQTDGKWYYCDRGTMLRNQYVPGGFWVGADGAWVE